MADPHPVCLGCHAPIAPGEPRWTQREPGELWHWSCAEAAGLTAGPLYRRFLAPLPCQTRVHDTPTTETGRRPQAPPGQTGRGANR